MNSVTERHANDPDPRNRPIPHDALIKRRMKFSIRSAVIIFCILFFVIPPMVAYVLNGHPQIMTRDRPMIQETQN